MELMFLMGLIAVVFGLVSLFGNKKKALTNRDAERRDNEAMFAMGAMDALAGQPGGEDLMYMAAMSQAHAEELEEYDEDQDEEEDYNDWNDEEE